jgi:hypothetical protein
MLLSYVSLTPLQDWISPLAARTEVSLRFVSSLPARRWDARSASNLNVIKPSSSSDGPLNPSNVSTQLLYEGGSICTDGSGHAKKKRRISDTFSVGMEGDTSLHWGQCLRAAKDGLNFVQGQGTTIDDQEANEVTPCSPFKPESFD